MANQHAQITSSGVDELIERLKNQGITAGQEKAESIVLDAQKRAEWIVNEATQEAQLLLKHAKAEAEAIKRAGHDALALATRDAYIKLRDALTVRFRREVTRLVGKKMAEKKFLEKLILALAGQVREKAGLDEIEHIRLNLPEDVVEAEKLRKDTEEQHKGALSHLVAELTGGMLRKGVKLDVSNELTGGIQLRLVDDEVVIDFTDEAVANLLLQHLQPRFHDLMEGIVK